MICNHYGCHVNTWQVAQRCHASKEGVSMLSIADGARSLGLESVAGRLTLEELCNSPLPAILHWEQKHFVVLYRIGRRGRMYVADPGKGRISYSRGEFERGWISTASGGKGCGIAMFFHPTDEFRVNPETDSNSGVRSLKFIIKYINNYRQYFIQIIAGLLLGCILQLILPFLTQAIVDIGIRHADIKLIWLIMLGELMIVLGRMITEFIRSWLLLHIGMRINVSLVSDFLIKLMRLPMSFFDTKLTGDIMQRMNDHGRIQQFVTGQLLGFIFTVMSFCVFGVVLAMYSMSIFSVFCIGSIMYGAWVFAFLHRRKVLDYELFYRQAENQNCTMQLISSIPEIKLQQCTKRRRWEWEDIQAELFGVQMKSLRLQQTMDAGSVFLNELKNIIITVLAATSVIDGSMTLGMMLAVQYVIGQLNSPVSQLIGFIYSLQDVRISLERINEVHGCPDEQEAQSACKVIGGPVDIVFHEVSFKYDPHALDYTLRNLTLRIPSRRVTAIVGASGSGKTTILKLILGYYHIAEGAISIGGCDISEIDIDRWRSNCGVVMQDGIIFSESIERNIAITDEAVDAIRLEEAARKAEIYDFIMSLPLGFRTKIGPDGIGLSQGQKQRILIARAIYRQPGCIIMDEATNSLDTVTERAIVGNMHSFYKGRTVIVVAHRLSTVRNADNIIVLDKGHIAESGTHEQLVALHGKYYSLIKNQLELGL
ncbi:MAG: peptidase domain-containing ABC transporter [Roseburia sp.]|nr:peptidase domain-containing ABC transporter [Roseburia sp.]